MVLSQAQINYLKMALYLPLAVCKATDQLCGLYCMGFGCMLLNDIYRAGLKMHPLCAIERRNKND